MPVLSVRYLSQFLILTPQNKSVPSALFIGLIPIKTIFGTRYADDT